MKKQVEIYKSNNGETSVEVTFEKESVWLNQNQLSDLFGRDRTVVGRHIRNIFKEGELEEEVVSADFAHTTQHGAITGKTQTKQTKFYNLDVIISVGYRVKSIQGTHFRQWANKRLKEYLIQGYSVNNQRLQQLQNSFKLLKGITENQEIQKPQIKEVIEVLADYAFGLDILDGYDHQNLTIENINPNTSYRIKYKDAKEAIKQLRDKFGGGKLFGNEKDNSFRSSISSIDQTFDGVELYKSIEEKAANLLYFVVKNHSFTDGNKRIAAWLFVWYLNKNHILYSKTGKKRIENNALATLTLMIALSKPDEKDLMIKVIINSINKANEAL